MRPTLFLKTIPIFIFLFLFDPAFAQQVSIWDQVPEEIKEKNSFKRMEWFYRQRSAPFDTVPSHIYLSELKTHLMICSGVQLVQLEFYQDFHLTGD